MFEESIYFTLLYYCLHCTFNYLRVIRGETLGVLFYKVVTPVYVRHMSFLVKPGWSNSFPQRVWRRKKLAGLIQHSVKFNFFKSHFPWLPFSSPRVTGLESATVAGLPACLLQCGLFIQSRLILYWLKPAVNSAPSHSWHGNSSVAT